MNVCDERLKRALLVIWEEESARLEEELKQGEPHVFSREFNQKMSRLMDNYKKKSM